MKNNKLLVILFIIVFMLAIAGGFGTYYFYNKSLDNNKQNESISKKKELIIYGSINSYSTYYCSKISEYHHEKVLTIETETENPILIDVATFDEEYRNIDSCVSFSEDLDSYVLYWDNGLKLYDIKTKEIRKIDVDLTKEQIEYLPSNYNQLLNGGFIYNDIESNVHYYYDLKNNKKMFTDYNNIHGLSDSSIILSNYLYAEKDGKSYILDIKNNKELISRKTAIPGSSASAIKPTCCTGKVFFMMYDFELMNKFNRQIFDEEGNLVTSLANDEEISFAAGQTFNGKEVFWINKVTKVRSYDKNGDLIK